MEKPSIKQMEEPSQEDIISIVNSIFQVSDFTKTEFSLEFKIEDMDFKSKFEGLARKLEDMRYVCKLEKMEEGETIRHNSEIPPKETEKVDECIMDSKNIVCNCYFICNDRWIL